MPFDDYVKSVAAQTITAEHPKEEDLRRAFSDLLISEEMFAMLGPAINSGRGMFLYGYPGNGKTSIAERITRCFGTTVWIPKVIDVEGQIIKLFDLANHEPIELAAASGLLRDDDFDHRWIEIRRPTIIAGGELRMEDLEIHYDPITKISEAPLQLKSNNGTFLIDDFGRQRMAADRAAEPLDRPAGEAVRLPLPGQRQEDPRPVRPAHPLLDQPRAEAARRRGVPPADPLQDQRDRPDRARCSAQMFDDLRPQARASPRSITTARRLPDRAPLPAGSNRPFRCCQPRDLLLQVRNYCVYNDLPLELKPEYFDFAAANYFTVM